MSEPRFQNTICKPVALTGFGYWSGLDVTVELRPAVENSGIRFIRCDLPNQPVIPAQISLRTQSPRRTTIGNGPASVEMIEHIMAALYGLQIDNCIIAVNRTEMPGFDGSAQSFVDAIDYAGKTTQPALKSQIRVHETIRIGDDENCWIQIEPAEDFRVSYRMKYPQPQIGRQLFDCVVSEETFRSELAPARTFLLKHEAEWLLQQGLGQRVSYQHVLVFGENGPIDNELRYENECVRHKTLDVIGDLALCGHEVLGHITASRTGHRLNGELVQRLLKHGAVMHASKPNIATSRSA